MHWKSTWPLFFFVIGPSAAWARAQSGGSAAPVTPPSAPSSTYQSAFADYKPYTEPVLMSWRAANDQVRDAGSGHGHDMAKTKAQSTDPHAGHDMSTMVTPEAAPVPAQVSADPALGHAAPGAQKPQAADPHAGHDMSKMTPPKKAASGPAKPHAPSPVKKPVPSQGAPKPQVTDPHAGHDMSKINTRPRGSNEGAVKNERGGHAAPPDHQPNKKTEKK